MSSIVERLWRNKKRGIKDVTESVQKVNDNSRTDHSYVEAPDAHKEHGFCIAMTAISKKTYLKLLRFGEVDASALARERHRKRLSD